VDEGAIMGKIFGWTNIPQVKQKKGKWKRDNARKGEKSGVVTPEGSLSVLKKLGELEKGGG